MLLERSAALTAKINAFQKLKNTADEADQFATRANQFSQVSLLMAGLRETLTALAEAGVAIEFELSDAAGYAAKARSLRDAVKENPTAINNPPFDIKYGFTDRLNSIATAGQKAAAGAWKSYVDKRAAFGADDVLSALAQVPQMKTSVSKIRGIRAEISGYGAALPPDLKAAVAKIDLLIKQHEAAWSDLDASDIPAAVIAFIRAAANHDALLTAFTPQVQSWLESRGLLGAFRIKLK